MYRSSSRQPYWPGVQANRNPQGQPDAEGSTDAGAIDSVNEFLLKEQESLSGAKDPGAGASQKREPDASRTKHDALPTAKAPEDGKDESERKTKPGSGNAAVVAAVAVLGVGAFMLGKAVVVGVQLLAPASSTVRVKIKPDAPSEYAETMRLYRQQTGSEGLEGEALPDAAGVDEVPVQPSSGQ